MTQRYSTTDIIQAEYSEDPHKGWALVAYEIDGERHEIRAGLSEQDALDQAYLLRGVLRTWLQV